jgi:hypothetical protein
VARSEIPIDGGCRGGKMPAFKEKSSFQAQIFLYFLSEKEEHMLQLRFLRIQREIY